MNRRSMPGSVFEGSYVAPFWLKPVQQTNQTFSTTTGSTMKRITYILLPILILYAHQNVSADEPFTISPETTYITEPLREDGRGVDYFTAIEKRLYTDTMKTDDNGYRIIVRELGIANDIPSPSLTNPEEEVSEDYMKAWRNRLYEKLGLDPDTKPSVSYQGPNEIVEAYLTSTFPDAGFDKRREIEDKWYHPWTEADAPYLAQWLEENSPALDIVAGAVKSPDFYIPVIRIDESVPLFDSIYTGLSKEIRDFARGFLARANYRIAQGDIDGAIDDIIACFRLGEKMKRQPHMMGYLFGVVVQSMGMAVDVAYSRNPIPSEEQLQRLLDECVLSHSQKEIDEILYCERLFSLELVQGIALGDYSMNPVSEDYSFDAFFGSSSAELRILEIDKVDWNNVLSRYNEHHLNPSQEVICIRNKWNRRNIDEMLSSDISQTELIRDLFFSEIFAGRDGFHEAGRRLQCLTNIHAITLGMLIHEKRNGTLPPPYITDADGNPKHSWRVLLLPYIGQQELYDKIRLDEPWDSEHNSQFHEIDVPFYTCPSDEKIMPGQTSYAVVIGEKTAFHERFAEFGPKCIPQILVLERQNPVCWMDPTQEFSMRPRWCWINGDGELRGNNHPGEVEMMGSNHPGGMNVGLRSGSVSFFSETISRDVFQWILEGTCPIEDIP
jgi:hypothetical protein